VTGTQRSLLSKAKSIAADPRPAPKSKRAGFNFLIEVKAGRQASGHNPGVKTVAAQSMIRTQMATQDDARSGFPATPFTSARLAREWKTMAAMVQRFCQGRHGSGDELCRECRSLLDYATIRLDRCRFGADKPTCANCPVHCYERRRREQMREVMRYAGPQMLWRHPILSLRHWLDGFRKAPDCQN
jgi:hypothetical protein